MMLGFFIGASLLKYRYEGSIEWMNTLTGLCLSLFFAFFPGATKRQSLEISEEGIFLNNYSSFWNNKQEYHWSKFRAIAVKSNRIELTNEIGSIEKVKLPIHTKEQIHDLKSYLREIARSKDLVFKS